MSDILRRLKEYNPPDRVLDTERRIAQDIFDAAGEIERLTAELAQAQEQLREVKKELSLEQIRNGTLKADVLFYKQRAESAEAEKLVPGENEIKTIVGWLRGQKFIPLPELKKEGDIPVFTIKATKEWK